MAAQLQIGSDPSASGSLNLLTEASGVKKIRSYSHHGRVNGHRQNSITTGGSCGHPSSSRRHHRHRSSISDAASALPALASKSFRPNPSTRSSRPPLSPQLDRRSSRFSSYQDRQPRYGHEYGYSHHHHSAAPLLAELHDLGSPPEFQDNYHLVSGSGRAQSSPSLELSSTESGSSDLHRNFIPGLAEDFDHHMNVLSAQPNHHNPPNHAKQDISGPAPDLFLGDGLDSLLGKTVLHLAAEYGHAHVVQTLLGRRMDVNLRDDMGDTALHLAARHGHHSVIQVLVASNATLDIRNSSGRTALQLSVIKGDIETVQLLLDQGATVI
ncbi:hypothetical protein QBC37DRAFT_367794 [Rhypophila decipiens]|uniref:Uncharacterized protein n=1 Tax=Rhypophila decipiens TaxID=261697 RepID=A0AAN7BBF6_9PEZI|nr:hypothetical protein QBC37DRAFT_367794 [Rhypophila decipiens]